MGAVSGLQRQHCREVNAFGKTLICDQESGFEWTFARLKEAMFSMELTEQSVPGSLKIQPNNQTGIYEIVVFPGPAAPQELHPALSVCESKETPYA